MTDPAVHAVELAMPCARCGERYSSHVSGDMLDRLKRAGVHPEEIVEAVERGALRWEITCRGCALAASN